MMPSESEIYFDEIEAEESREKALVDIGFFEAIRGFLTCAGPIGEPPTREQRLTSGLDERLVDFVDGLFDVRAKVAATPDRYVRIISSLDVWLARMRGRWQVGDDEC